MGIRWSETLFLRPIYRPVAHCELSDAQALRSRQQAPPHHVEVRQAKHRESACSILGQAPISDLHEAPEPLDYVKGMLASRPVS